jgi:glycine/D-amino acid oxidase-like deaminating enzyme
VRRVELAPVAALVDATPASYWLDRPDRPPARPALDGDRDADLVVVGAGYTGLWAALLAKEADPSRDVVVIEAGRVADQASGRNGGFCSASLTHGVANGAERFPDELDRLQRLGWDNLDAIEAAIERHGIDCSFERTGALAVATHPWQVDELAAAADQERAAGEDVTWLECDAIRAEIHSPTFQAATWRHSGEALVDPARLAWGLATGAEALGVTIAEQTPMIGLLPERAAMVVRTPGGAVRARRVVLATGAFPSPIRRIGRLVAPVYDHALMTEPLTAEQVALVGWARRQGLSDVTNLFHYTRLTDDRSAQGGDGPRILWGGYDAVYHYGNRIHPSLEQSSSHETLVRHFFETFPQLEGIRFSHRWGGVIDTCTRFSVTFGTAFDTRVAYAVGYTGLGVGASRFGARVCLDLLDHPDSDLTRLDLVRSSPLPFPPEPLRWTGITLTRRALERADRNEGRRGPWLRLLDRLGLGFDS